MTPELKKQIEQEAKDYAQKQWDNLIGKGHLQRKTLMMYAHQAGAKGYAEKWQRAEERVKELEQWQHESLSIIDPIIEWGQAQKDIPAGSSISSEVLRRAKLFKELEQRAERMEKALREIQGLVE